MGRYGDHKNVHDTREKIRAAYADGVLGQIAGALKGAECPEEQRDSVRLEDALGALEDSLGVAVRALKEIARYDPDSVSYIARAALERIKCIAQGVVDNTESANKETT